MLWFLGNLLATIFFLFYNFETLKFILGNSQFEVRKSIELVYSMTPNISSGLGRIVNICMIYLTSPWAKTFALPKSHSFTW